MPKEKVTKPHHKLAVTTVSLVSFHDLLPCFPNDTLILNPFSLYTHFHDKILSGVNDDDELWPWMKDSDELLIIQVLVLESTPWCAGVLRNLILFLYELVHNGCGFDSLLSFLWWGLIVMDALPSVGGLLPLMSRSSLHPFLLPPDESELQVYIRPLVFILLFQVSFSCVETLSFFYSHACHCLCHCGLLSYPRVSFFHSMCFLSVWHYCVWMLSWFILQWVCVILWKGSSFSSFQYSYDLREFWIVYRLQVLKYTTEVAYYPSYVVPVVIGLWVVFSCCDDAPIVAWLWQRGGAVPDTVRVPFFAIANPSLLCVRYAAGRYSIMRGLG